MGLIHSGARMPAAPPFLSVVVPAFQEAGRLPSCLPRAAEVLAARGDAELIVVDDGSADDTAAVAERVGAAWPFVRVLREPHRGKGGAVRAGMLAARGRYRFFADADWSMPPEELERFLPPALDGFDVAIGSREVPGAVRVGEPEHRHWLGRGFNWLVRAALVPGVADSQCGFKCFTAAAAEQLFGVQRIDGFAFDVELLFLARRAGLRIVEVPVTWHYDGDSKVRPLRDTRRMLTEVARIRWNAAAGRYRAV